MTREDLLKFHEQVCTDAKELMNLKNRDYAGHDGLEPFANFTRCEAMGICATESGFMVRVKPTVPIKPSHVNNPVAHHPV